VVFLEISTSNKKEGA